MIPAVSHSTQQNEHLTSVVLNFTGGKIAILKVLLIENDYINYLSKPIGDLIEQI
jgi:hypothetical protein